MSESRNRLVNLLSLQRTFARLPVRYEREPTTTILACVRVCPNVWMDGFLLVVIIRVFSFDQDLFLLSMLHQQQQHTYVAVLPFIPSVCINILLRAQYVCDHFFVRADNAGLFTYSDWSLVVCPIAHTLDTLCDFWTYKTTLFLRKENNRNKWKLGVPSEIGWELCLKIECKIDFQSLEKYIPWGWPINHYRRLQNWFPIAQKQIKINWFGSNTYIYSHMWCIVYPCFNFKMRNRTLQMQLKYFYAYFARPHQYIEKHVSTHPKKHNSG